MGTRRDNQVQEIDASSYRDVTILVIEDEIEVAQITKRIAEKSLECNVLLSQSGDTALELLAQHSTDIVITDMRLPGLHGLELLEKIRDTYPEVSIIVMTGFSDDFPYVDAVNTGADDFLTKPFQAAELQAKLMRVVRERRLRHASALAEEKYRSLFESSSEGMALLDGETYAITDVNRACAELFGEEKQELLGQPLFSLLREEEGDRFAQWTTLCKTLGKGTIGDMGAVRPNGNVFFLDISLTFIQVHDESIALVTCKDVTEVREIHRQLADAAQRDKLSGLLNKSAFENRMAWSVSNAHQQQSGLVLMLIDLDNFKQCNDTHGHQVGDKLLAGVGEVIRMSIRTTVADVGFRCGGDEFAVILSDTDIVGAGVVAERMLGEFRGRETYGTSMSIGMAQLVPGKTASELISCADAALYDAKAHGKDTVRASAV